MATTLCTRIAGAPAQALTVIGYTNGQGQTVRQWNERQVQCRAGPWRYYLRIDADRREVSVIQREQSTDAAAMPPGNGAVAEQADINGTNNGRNSPNGDLPAGGISPREAPLLAQRYLRLVGLPLPANARLVRQWGGYDFTYACHDALSGVGRVLSVRIDLRDGSLERLQNLVYQRLSVPPLPPLQTPSPMPQPTMLRPPRG
jgi:hypothetical protein